MIIECPSCKTKFSVDSSQILSAANPRFHCSRCDNVFRIAEESKPAADEVTASLPTETLLDAPLSWAEQLELLPKRPRFDSEPIRASESFQEPVRNFNDLLEGEKQPIITAPWPDPVGHEPLEADMTDVIQRHFSAESLPKANVLRTRMQRPSSAAAMAHVGAGAEMVPTWPGPHVASTLTEQQNILAKKAKRVTVIDDEPEVEAAGAVVNFPRTPTVDSVSGYTSYAPPLLQQISALLFVLSVPLALTAGLWGLGKQIEESPQFVQGLFSLIQTAPPSLPPNGVELAGVRSEVVTLDDGNQVIDISGEIVNNSNLSLDDLQVEAAVFSADNQPLKKIQVATHTGLQPSQPITALPERTIVELQDQRALGSSTLKPNMRAPFRVIITDASSDTAWFTTRVYSVRPEIVDSSSS